VSAELIQRFQTMLDPMLGDLQQLVEAESPSRDREAVAACAALVASMGQRLLGALPDRAEVDGQPYLSWSFGAPRVALLCHLDTVWPMGTIDRLPFRVDGDRAYGAGIFDMMLHGNQEQQSMQQQRQSDAQLYAAARTDMRVGITVGKQAEYPLQQVAGRGAGLEWCRHVKGSICELSRVVSAHALGAGRKASCPQAGRIITQPAPANRSPAPGDITVRKVFDHSASPRFCGICRADAQR